MADTCMPYPEFIKNWVRAQRKAEEQLQSVKKDDWYEIARITVETLDTVMQQAEEQLIAGTIPDREVRAEVLQFLLNYQFSKCVCETY